jgi:hypothetical protein
LAKKRHKSKGGIADTPAGAAAPVTATKVPVRMALEVPESVSRYYANFIEISQTSWDFALIFTTLPAKPTPAKVAEMQATGVLAWPAEVVVNFPPTLMAGLIRALNMQKEAYEKENGVELKEMGQ